MEEEVTQINNCITGSKYSIKWVNAKGDVEFRYDVRCSSIQKIGVKGEWANEGFGTERNCDGKGRGSDETIS